MNKLISPKRDDGQSIVSFYELVDEITLLWADRNHDLLIADNVDYSNALASHIAYRLYPLRDDYLAGKPVSEKNISDLYDDSVYTTKKSFKQGAHFEKKFNVSVVYANGPRMCSYLNPILDAITKKGHNVILLTDYNFYIGERNITRCILSKISANSDRYNKFLSRNFHSFYDYALKLRTFVNCVKPIRIIGIDGCQTSLKILASIGKSAGIPTYCIQQGWPSFIHSGFRRLPFDNFLSWGKGFNQILKKFNPQMNILSVGYPYQTGAITDRSGILFCLQAPLYVSTISSMASFIDTIIKCANEFHMAPIFIREHPDYPLPSKIREWIYCHQNITDCSSLNIHDLYGKSKYVVSHFSSCLMEGFIHGCIPISLDFSGEWRYSPDIESCGIGYICQNWDQLKACILKHEDIKEYSGPTIPNIWCEAIGDDAVKNIINAMNL